MTWATQLGKSSAAVRHAQHVRADALQRAEEVVSEADGTLSWVRKLQVRAPVQAPVRKDLTIRAYIEYPVHQVGSA